MYITLTSSCSILLGAKEYSCQPSNRRLPRLVSPISIASRELLFLCDKKMPTAEVLEVEGLDEQGNHPQHPPPSSNCPERYIPRAGFFVSCSDITREVYL